VGFGVGRLTLSPHCFSIAGWGNDGATLDQCNEIMSEVTLARELDPECAYALDAKEIRIMGSKGEPLRTLVAASSGKTAGFGVPSFVLKCRAIQNKSTNSYIIEISL
jgi:hypothetical protein